jgi:hypothetical protein
MIFKKVVFPHPDGPMRVVKLPRGMHSETRSSTASSPPGVKNDLLILTAERALGNLPACSFMILLVGWLSGV